MEYPDKPINRAPSSFVQVGGKTIYRLSNGIRIILMIPLTAYYNEPGKRYLIATTGHHLGSYTEAVTKYVNDQGSGIIEFWDPRVKNAWKTHSTIFINRDPAEHWALRENEKPIAYVAPEILLPNLRVKIRK